MRQGVRRGFVFDDGGLLANLSALANVTLPLRYHADLFGLDGTEIEVRARRALAELRVQAADHHALPAHLSFGVRKRVSIARALAIEPNFVFFDDPDGGLDANTRAIVHGILERFYADKRTTLLVTTNSGSLIDRLRGQAHPADGSPLVRQAELTGGRLTEH
jgi:ABC-type lipoprotein export system ATPase subunit